MAIVKERETDDAAQQSENVARIDARAAFVAVRLADGGAAVVCRLCGGSLRLRTGLTSASEMRHTEDCAIGAAIGALAARKPTTIRMRGN